MTGYFLLWTEEVDWCS